MTCKKYTFTEICYACPESYVLFDEEEKNLAYIKLRYGHLKVFTPSLETTIWQHDFEKDGGGMDSFKGMFDSQEERETMLKEALIQVLKFNNLPHENVEFYLDRKLD